MMARALALLSTCLLSAAAWACPVCGAATDTKPTYQAMTLVMSALPLLSIGSVAFWVVLRFRRAAREEQAELLATRAQVR